MSRQGLSMKSLRDNKTLNPLNIVNLPEHISIVESLGEKD